MKRSLVLLFVSFFLLPTLCHGQEGGVLKFQGIPVAGSEELFVEKLADKGFALAPSHRNYLGPFIEKTVELALQMENDAVRQLTLTFPDTTAQMAIAEYNQLLNLYRKDKNFMDFNMNEVILENTDLSKGFAKGKKFAAHFSYYDPERKPSLMEALMDKLTDFFTEKQIARLKELAREIADAPESKKAALRAEMLETMKQMGLGQDPEADAKPDAGKVFQFMGVFMEGLQSLSDGDVWFEILERPNQKERPCQVVLHFDPVHP